MTAKKSTKRAAKSPPKKPKLSPEVARIEKERQERAKKRAEATTEVKNGADKPVVTTTVAPQTHHAETVQAVEQGNKDVTPEIKHDGTALGIAKLAWHEVKGAGDPEFDQCVPPHRDKYLSHCEAILKGNAPAQDDTMLAKFEREVSRIKSEQGKEKS